MIEPPLTSDWKNGQPPTSDWTNGQPSTLGIGVTEQPLQTSDQDRTWTDGEPRTSAQGRTLSSPEEVWQRLGIGMTEPPQNSVQDRTQRDGKLPTSARDQMQVDKRLQTSFKGMAMVPEMPESDAEFQAVQVDTQISDEAIHDWSLNSKVYCINRKQVVRTVQEGCRTACVEMPWDGRRMLDGSVWKEVCLGGVICLGKLSTEDMEGCSREGVLSLKKRGAAVGGKCQEHELGG